MEYKTKFALGDTVYFYGDGHGLFKAIVHEINISSDKGKQSVIYCLSDHVTRHELNCLTKEEAIETL